jgi:AcrR family transcriptional regulator
MSGKSESSSKSSTRARRSDRRIVRTRDKLGDALIELMQEQPFEAITVQEVLDRAKVSRSTFYSHYRDKNDLFLSDVEEFLERLGTLLTRRGAPVNRLFPLEELFSHVAESASVTDAINAAGKGPDVRELAIGCFARLIEKRLILAGVTMPAVDLQATAHSLAGSVFSLLEWWLRDCRAATPKHLDAHFHHMAWGGLRAAPAEAIVLA